jgi:uncharacterized coiled-coil protein SlyX
MAGWRFAIAAGVAAATLAASLAAKAQVVRSPGEIKSCLCKEQAVAALNSEVQAQSRVYEETRQAFEALDKQVQTSRPQVNVNNPGDVEAFKRLLERRDGAADTLAGSATQSYADAVQRYNESVADYNGACAGKSFDPDQIAEQRRTLDCPKQ